MKNKIITNGLSWIVLSSVLMIAACGGAVSDISVTLESTLLPTKALATATASATLAVSRSATPTIKTTPTAVSSPTAIILPSLTSTQADSLFDSSRLRTGSYLIYSDSPDYPSSNVTYYAVSSDGTINDDLWHGRMGTISPNLKHLAYGGIIDSQGDPEGVSLKDLESLSAPLKSLAPKCMFPAWAPDSIHLAVVCPVPNPAGSGNSTGSNYLEISNIFVLSIEDDSKVLVGDCLTESAFKKIGAYECFNPVWSPDGNWIASSRYFPGSGDSSAIDGLYLTDTSCLAEPAACIDKTYGPFGEPTTYAWSPDSRNLVEYLPTGQQLAIFNVKARKSHTLLVLDERADVESLAWSLDGKWIAYNQADSSSYWISLIPFAGGVPINLNHRGHLEFWLDVP